MYRLCYADIYSDDVNIDVENHLRCETSITCMFCFNFLFLYRPICRLFIIKYLYASCLEVTDFFTQGYP